MVDIVRRMGWSYISIIYEESNYGIKVSPIHMQNTPCAIRAVFFCFTLRLFSFPSFFLCVSPSFLNMNMVYTIYFNRFCCRTQWVCHTWIYPWDAKESMLFWSGVCTWFVLNLWELKRPPTLATNVFLQLSRVWHNRRAKTGPGKTDILLHLTDRYHFLVFIRLFYLRLSTQVCRNKD